MYSEKPVARVGLQNATNEPRECRPARRPSRCRKGPVSGLDPLAALRAGGVKAARVDREGSNVIAWLDTKHGLMRAGEGVTWRTL